MDFYLRKATQDDIDILFQWANDEVVRKNSFNTEPIPYDVHAKWFKSVMEDKLCVQYILEGIDEKNSVIKYGQIRFKYNEQKRYAEVGYSIDVKYRGLGYGKKIIKLGTEAVMQEFDGLQKLVAKVKPTNIASYKSFVNNGYSEKYLELELKIEKRR